MIRIDNEDIYNRSVVQSNLLSRNLEYFDSSTHADNPTLLQTLTPFEKKIVLFLISRVSKDDQEFRTCIIEIRKLARIIGFPISGGTDKKKFRRTIESLAGKRFWVEVDGMIRYSSWIEDPGLTLNCKYIELTLNRNMKQYILQLTDSYTMAKYGYIAKLDQRYAIDIYLYLKSIQRASDWVASPSFFMNLVKGTYEHFSDMERRVLIPAISEINEKTDIYVKYTTVKVKRNVTEIHFDISLQKSSYIPDYRHDDIDTKHSEKLSKALSEKTAI